MGTDTRQTYKQIDRQTETGEYFFRTVGLKQRPENIKVAILPIDSITVLP